MYVCYQGDHFNALSSFEAQVLRLFQGVAHQRRAHRVGHRGLVEVVRALDLIGHTARYIDYTHTHILHTYTSIYTIIRKQTNKVKYSYIYTYIHTYIHKYINTHKKHHKSKQAKTIHTYVHTCIPT